MVIGQLQLARLYRRSVDTRGDPFQTGLPRDIGPVMTRKNACGPRIEDVRRPVRPRRTLLARHADPSCSRDLLDLDGVDELLARSGVVVNSRPACTHYLIMATIGGRRVANWNHPGSRRLRTNHRTTSSPECRIRGRCRRCSTG